MTSSFISFVSFVSFVWSATLGGTAGRLSIATLALVATSALMACEDAKSCSVCSEEEGTEFCVECPTADLCIASIEVVATGEVLFSCEEAPGESCATNELVASCPDL